MIYAVLECLNSRRDLNGNCYFAFRYTDTKTGKQIQGTVSGGESNVYSIVRAMGYTAEEVYYTRQELPIREFNRLTKEWKYAGCTDVELARFIRTGDYREPKS